LKACDLWREKLDAFVDGELPAETQREFDAHLRGCPSCASELAARAQLKLAVKRAAVRRFTPSAEFRRKIEAQLAPRRSARRAVWAWIPALGAVAAILFAVLWFTRTPANNAKATLGEVVDLHVGGLASSNPVDVVSTDLHTVKPWFEGKLPFAVSLPDLNGTPFTLLGGRIVYLNQNAGAGLLFQFRKHRLSVFIFQDRAVWKNLGSESKPEQHASFWVESFSVSGLRYFVIADTSAENVEQLSSLMKNAAGAE
jgi:anti-sigma factor RsiW